MITIVTFDQSIIEFELTGRVRFNLLIYHCCTRVALYSGNIIMCICSPDLFVYYLSHRCHKIVKLLLIVSVILHYIISYQQPPYNAIIYRLEIQHSWMVGRIRNLPTFFKNVSFRREYILKMPRDNFVFYHVVYFLKLTKYSAYRCYADILYLIRPALLVYYIFGYADN